MDSGGLLILLARLDISLNEVNHSFPVTPVWLQMHGIPSYVLDNTNSLISLAKEAGYLSKQNEKTLAVQSGIVRVRISIDPALQLVSGADWFRPELPPL